MAQALPFTKLASLLVKTLAKPLSKRIKHEFSRYEFTKQILISIGQTNHTITSRMQIWSAGYTVRSIKPLEPDAALKDGSEFVGEAFIFLVSGTLVVLEYNRSQESARTKEEARREKVRQETASLNAKLHTLDVRLKAVEKVVERNAASILSLGGPKYERPPSQELVPIVSDDDEIMDMQAATKAIKSKTAGAAAGAAGAGGADQKQTAKDSTTAKTTTTTTSESQQPQNEQQSTTSKPWWKIW